MDSNLLPYLRSGRLVLVIAPWRPAREIMLVATARLAARGEVQVLDGGNSFDAFHLARLIRRLTARLEEALGRILVARAFTCYQLAALLRKTPRDASPKLILDFLSSFFDEGVSAGESNRLFAESLALIQRLNQSAPVVVSVRPPYANQLARKRLFEQVRAISEDVVFLEYVQPYQLKRLL